MTIVLASRVHRFMSIWWNGGNQLISSPAVMKRVVQAAPGPACTRQCPGVSVLYLFPVHARSVRPSPLTPPSPGPSAHKRLPCPGSVSLHQWPWHKSQTFNQILRKVFPWHALFHATTFNFIWISIFYNFYFSVRRRELLMMWMKTNWDIRNVRDGNYNNVINRNTLW